MKAIHGCTLGLLTILTGAGFSRSHVIGASQGSAKTPNSTVSQAATSGQKTHLHKNYGNLPLSFEVNQGQTDSRVKFLSRGAGYTLFLARDEAVLTLKRSSVVSGQLLPKIGPSGHRAFGPLKVKDSFSSNGSITQSLNGSIAFLRMKLLNANPSPPVTALDQLPGKSNYFIGNDPRKWRTNVSNYGKVKYARVYPGVDMVYYGNQRQLEFDFVVAPGADPATIRFSVAAGLSRLRSNQDGGLMPPLQIAPDGDLVVRVNEDEVRFHKPVVYQSRSAALRQSTTDNRQLLEGRFVLVGKGQIGFEIAAYDRSKQLIIDPVLSYSTYLGGSGVEEGRAITVDSAGSAYVTGYTTSTNFPTASPLQAAYGGGAYDAFVTKLNVAGNALVYSTYFGGSGEDFGEGIAVDTLGNAYVTGGTSSTNFPTVGPIQAVFGGGLHDAFVTKLNLDGSALVYSTYLGGAGTEQGRCITVDSARNAYVTGWTDSTNFPTASPIQMALGGGFDAFVTKVNAAGNALVYSTYLGGAGDDRGLGIAADLAGNTYVTGDTNSTNFPTASPLQAAFGGVYDAFVTKLGATGALVFSTYLGGSDTESGTSIAVDSSGNSYVTGNTVSTNFPTAIPFQATNHGHLDAFVSKLKPDGSALIYSTYLGGGGDEFGWGIAVDSTGNAYVTGSTKSADFPTASPLQATFGATADAFVTKLNPAGSALIYSTYLGGNSVNDFESAGGIAVDPVGNAYVTGLASSTDYPTVNAVQPVYGGALQDAFVAKISPADLPGVSLTPSTVNFTASQVAGTTSSAQAVRLLNVGSPALTISSIAAMGDFAEADTCGNSVAGGATCTINVTFKPTASGSRTGTLTITDSAAGSPHTAALLGTGTDFSVGPASGSQTIATVTAGQTASYTLALAGTAGFSGPLALTCSGAPTAATCSISPAQLTLNGTTALNATVSVATTARSIAAPNFEIRPPAGGTPFLPAAKGAPRRVPGALWWVALTLIAGLTWNRKVRADRTRPHEGARRATIPLGFPTALLFAVIVAAVSMLSCGGNSGGGGNSGTPAGTYTLGVKATFTSGSGNLTHDIKLTLTVQ